jgi:probable DNA metabolism protein
MIKTVVYDGTWQGFLCAVFDVYEYKYLDVDIVSAKAFNRNIFGEEHVVCNDEKHANRVWQGLEKKASKEAQKLWSCFLSEQTNIENVLLQYIQYAFSQDGSIEKDFSNAAVLEVSQLSRKVWREKHRMEAFVRFQKTADHLYFAIIEPDYNVLPLIKDHFRKRYADQKWLVYDTKRKYGIFYNLEEVAEVQINFEKEMSRGKKVQTIYNSDEEIYQQLWHQYFKSVNIAARKNTKLHIQHMPRRYWKYLTEKT